MQTCAPGQTLAGSQKQKLQKIACIMSLMPNLDYQNADVYFRDEFVPFSKANVSIASSPVLYGLSIYTVFSINWNAKQQKLYAFRLDEHYKRLINSAKIM